MELMNGEAFEDYFSGILGHGFISMSICLGEELGLFDVLSSFDKPVTSSEIAAKSNLQERYVREWLGGMVSAKILVQETDENTFYFPPQYRDRITAKWFGLLIPIMGLRHEKLKACFRAKEIEGISWSEFPETITWMDKYRGNTCNEEVMRAMLDQVPGLIPKLESGIEVADVGCGAGRVINFMSGMFPNSNFVGFDSAPLGLKLAVERSTEDGLKNVKFHCVDAAKFADEWLEKFDYVITFDTCHDLPHPIKALVEMRKIMKPSGYFSMVDIDLKPKPSDNYGDLDAASFFSVSTYVCLPSSACQNGSELLGAAWGREKAQQVVKEAGMSIEKVTVVPIWSHLHVIATK